MKKFFSLLLTLCFFAGVLSAQEHISFKGIPLGQDKDVFIKSLKDAGFTLKTELDGGTFLSGDFAGEKGCTVIALWTDKTHVVWKVAVQVEESTWYSLKSTYNKFKENLTAKYGAPTDSYQFFSKPYYEGDGYELSAIRLEKAFFASYFNAPGGTIGLRIDSSGSKYYVNIGYEDGPSIELKKREEKAALSNDL